MWEASISSQGRSRPLRWGNEQASSGGGTKMELKKGKAEKGISHSLELGSYLQFVATSFLG